MSKIGAITWFVNKTGVVCEQNTCCSVVCEQNSCGTGSPQPRAKRARFYFIFLFIFFCFFIFFFSVAPLRGSGKIWKFENPWRKSDWESTAMSGKPWKTMKFGLNSVGNHENQCQTMEIHGFGSCETVSPGNVQNTRILGVVPDQTQRK